MKRLQQIQKVQELVYELKIRDATVTEVLTVPPDAMMSEVRFILRSRKITAAPVIRDAKLLGIVSVEDYINWLAEGSTDCPVADRMSRDVIVMYDDEALVDAIKNFEKYRYYEFPVLRRDNEELLGIVTKFDVIVALLKALDIDFSQKERQEYQPTHFFDDIQADQTALVLRYRVNGDDLAAGGEASSKLKRNLGYLGIHPDIVRRVAIATYEAEMNLLIYGGGGEIEATLDRDLIRIRVSDQGPGIADIEQAMKPGFSTASDWVRELGFGAGMGLPNIKNCAQDLDIQSSVGTGTVLNIAIPLEEG